MNLTYCSAIFAHEDGGYTLVKSSITLNEQRINIEDIT